MADHSTVIAPCVELTTRGPIQLVSYDEAGKFVVQDAGIATLTNLVEAERKRCSCNPGDVRFRSVATVGKAREGKSFFCNALCDLPCGTWMPDESARAFARGDDYDPCTVGVFVRALAEAPGPSGTLMIRLVIDTEGLDALKKANGMVADAMVGIGLTMSSTLVYNVKEVLDLEAINSLERAVAAQVPSTLSEDDAPRLVVLIRDSQLRLGDRFESVRDLVLDAFDSHASWSDSGAADCFGRDRIEVMAIRKPEGNPGEKEWEDLRPAFRDGIEAAVAEIWAASDPKAVGGEAVTSVPNLEVAARATLASLANLPTLSISEIFFRHKVVAAAQALSESMEWIADLQPGRGATYVDLALKQLNRACAAAAGGLVKPSDMIDDAEFCASRARVKIAAQKLDAARETARVQCVRDAVRGFQRGARTRMDNYIDRIDALIKARTSSVVTLTVATIANAMKSEINTALGGSRRNFHRNNSDLIDAFETELQAAADCLTTLSKTKARTLAAKVRAFAAEVEEEKQQRAEERALAEEANDRKRRELQAAERRRLMAQQAEIERQRVQQEKEARLAEEEARLQRRLQMRKREMEEQRRLIAAKLAAAKRQQEEEEERRKKRDRIIADIEARRLFASIFTDGGGSSSSGSSSRGTNRCEGTTQRGTRCQRRVKDGYYCHDHGW